MPRAGSELLQCLLSQHPAIYGSATSPLLEYLYGASSNCNTVEARAQPRDVAKATFNSFCRAGAEGYYKVLTDKGTIVDKSRGWIKHAETLWAMYPEAKVLSMIRPVGDVLASLDKAYYANPTHPDSHPLPESQEKRHQLWLQPTSMPLGLHLLRMKERLSRGDDSRIKFIQYDDLVGSPVEVMRDVFDFLEEEPFDVDPNNVVKTTVEDDRVFGIFGNHAVRRTIDV